jgi:ADP-ribose pyrophosphatase YjhB (NUDIX family)
LRDGSGLKRGDFYRRYMQSVLPEGIQRELPAGMKPPLSFRPRLRLARQANPAPEIAVINAILRDGKLLLTRREDFDVWCLPGGSLDPGEGLTKATRREAVEETGLQVVLTRLVGVYTRLSQNGRCIHLVVFAARPTGGRRLVCRDAKCPLAFPA